MSIVQLDAKLRVKRSTTASEVPTIGPSTDHTDGTWDSLDIYSGEFFLNTADGKLWIGVGDAAVELDLSGYIKPAQVYEVDTAPDPEVNEGLIIMVSDDVGGYTPAFSDGTNWRRTSDRAIISTT